MVHGMSNTCNTRMAFMVVSLIVKKWKQKWKTEKKGLEESKHVDTDSDPTKAEAKKLKWIWLKKWEADICVSETGLTNAVVFCNQPDGMCVSIAIGKAIVKHSKFTCTENKTLNCDIFSLILGESYRKTLILTGGRQLKYFISRKYVKQSKTIHFNLQYIVWLMWLKYKVHFICQP